MSAHLIGFIGAVLAEAVVVSLVAPQTLPMEMGIAGLGIGAALITLAAAMLSDKPRVADLAMAGEKLPHLARRSSR